LKNINFFIQRLQTFYIFVTLFYVFNVFFIFSERFLHLWAQDWGVFDPLETRPSSRLIMP